MGGGVGAARAWPAAYRQPSAYTLSRMRPFSQRTHGVWPGGRFRTNMYICSSALKSVERSIGPCIAQPSGPHGGLAWLRQAVVRKKPGPITGRRSGHALAAGSGQGEPREEIPARRNMGGLSWVQKDNWQHVLLVPLVVQSKKQTALSIYVGVACSMQACCIRQICHAGGSRSRRPPIPTLGPLHRRG